MWGIPPQGIPVWERVLRNPGTLRRGVSHHRGSPGWDKVLENPGTLGHGVSHHRGIPGWDKVLGNPGTLRHGVSHHRGSRDGIRYLGIPGHLDVGYPHHRASQEGTRYSGIPGHLDVGYSHAPQGIPGHLDMGYPTTGDPSMGEGTWVTEDTHTGGQLQFQGQSLWTLGEVNSNLSILESTLTMAGISGHGWGVTTALNSGCIFSACNCQSLFPCLAPPLFEEEALEKGFLECSRFILTRREDLMAFT